MGRRRKGDAVSGWICLDKPYDLTSTHAVSRVRRAFNAQKAGHAGTLDPLATGILPIALGEATKTVPFLVDADKAYRFTIAWGRATATCDREGETTAQSDVRPSVAEVEAVLPGFVGEISQVPPAYSAIKVGGERAYDLARAGETVELAARTVTIHSARVARRRPRHPGDRVRQGDLRPRAGPRSRRPARRLRPCERAAQDARRGLHRTIRGDAGIA
jgi:tRNA pseudouridine55 synthase